MKTAIKKFFSLAEVAAKNGGFWVSASGGTANVVAGEIARHTGETFEAAWTALDIVGRELYPDGWYDQLFFSQPFGWDMDAAENARWDAALIARAACR